VRVAPPGVVANLADLVRTAPRDSRPGTEPMEDLGETEPRETGAGTGLLEEWERGENQEETAAKENQGGTVRTGELDFLELKETAVLRAGTGTMVLPDFPAPRDGTVLLEVQDFSEHLARTVYREEAAKRVLLVPWDLLDKMEPPDSAVVREMLEHLVCPESVDDLEPLVLVPRERLALRV